MRQASERPAIVRDAEYARIVVTLGEGRTEFREMLVVGEIGSGKSVLLTAAADHARKSGALVLRARGNAVESDLPLGCLHQLLAGHHGSAGRLAQTIALGGRVTDSDVAALAEYVVALLSASCATGPVLLVVDDAQHMDRYSVQVMNFLATRLRTKPVTLLLAARNVMPLPWERAIPTIRLQALTDGAAARLADAQRCRPTGRTRLRVLHEAAGSPLAIVELSRAYGKGGESAARRSNTPDIARICQLLAGHFGELPTTTRRLMLYAAAAGGERLPTSVTELATAAWEPAQRADVLVVDEGEVRFQHPLAGVACYWSATAFERQRVHQELSTAFVTMPAYRAWHLGQACVGADESVAAALEDAANAIETTRGICAAAAALHRAAECSPEPEDQARRRVTAMTAASRLGAPAWVRELHTEVLARTDDAEILYRAGCHASQALSLSAQQRDAFTLAVTVVNEAEDRRQATAAVMSEVAFRSGMPEHRTAVCQVLPDIADGVTKALVSARVEPRLAESLSTLVPTSGTGWELSLALGEMAWYADESAACVEHLQRAFVELNKEHSPGLTLFCAPLLVSALLDTGRWDEAGAMLDEMADRAAVHEIGQLGASVSALRAELHARRGQAAQATELLQSAWYAVDLDENRSIAALLRRAAGKAAFAAGDTSQAYRHFRALFDTDLAPLHYFISYRSIRDLVAAAARADRRSEAVRLLAAVRAQLGPATTTRMRLQLHHAEALVGQTAKVEDDFRSVVNDPAAEQWPFDRALARLHYAEWLRRQRRFIEARAQLSEALDRFNSIGAEPLVRRAQGELQACLGAGADERWDDLTAQQCRIVQLAGQGLRNQDIADRLQISKRTVDAHLRNAYAKLGVTNRHQLRFTLENR